MSLTAGTSLPCSAPGSRSEDAWRSGCDRDRQKRASSAPAVGRAAPLWGSYWASHDVRGSANGACEAGLTVSGSRESRDHGLRGQACRLEELGEAADLGSAPAWSSAAQASCPTLPGLAAHDDDPAAALLGRLVADDVDVGRDGIVRASVSRMVGPGAEALGRAATHETPAYLAVSGMG